MEFVKNKNSKLACGAIKIHCETPTHYVVSPYNFYHNKWETFTRKMKKEWLHSNYTRNSLDLKAFLDLGAVPS